ncbi:phosphotransferase [Mycobacterium sp. 48b]|uniref:phosphotransferase n=1 Tax=Mycobacterium sp. 48b TaxID=3400426 RepID=UPI003AAFC153
MTTVNPERGTVAAPGVVDTAEEADPQWLTAALNSSGIAATVGQVTAERVGTGQMGSCSRLFIDYSDGSGPDRLIIKLPAVDANSRAAGTLSYRCETSFYRDYAHRIKARLPRCYYAAADAEANGFTLLLEDLAPAEQGDQIAGCTVDEALAAAVNVAGLHASTWNDPAVRELDWLIPDLTAMPEFAAELLSNATDQFLQRYTLSPETAVVLRRFSDEFMSWAAGRREPFALLHGDYRLDNLLFAKADAPDPVVAVDWQVMSTGLPLRDVALLVAPGLSIPDRRAGERAVIEAYHRRLAELGVTGYSLESCWEDYRYAQFQGPFVTVLGALVGQASERGDRMFTVMAERSAAAITDLDAFALLGT